MRESSQRSPRFRREPTSAFRLTKRDQEMILQVKRYKFLRSTHIAMLVGGSHQGVSRRLQLLYHHGYLDRPREQLRLTQLHGNGGMIYGLPRKYVGSLFLEHTLMIADIMVKIECDCRNTPGLRFLDLVEISPNSIRWSVTISYKGSTQRVSVIPDRLFGIEATDTTGKKRIHYYFMEADRGTMPVVRKYLKCSSIQRKILGYNATRKNGVLRNELKISSFTVLIVTTSEMRVHHITKALSDMSLLVENVITLNKHKLSITPLITS